MASNYDPRRSRKTSHRKTTQLGIEQLENRMMNAVDGMEQQLQQLIAPMSVGEASVGSTQVVSTITNTVGNTAPTVATIPRLVNATDVRSRSAVVSVLGADNAGESRLTYTWSVNSFPSGGTVTFASNGTNAAKQNTATFNKPGTYSLRVTIRDESGLTTASLLQVNVVATLTTLRLQDTAGTELNPSLTHNVSGTTQTVRVIGLDQFGTAMTSTPTAVWTRVAAPSGGTVTPSVANGVATLTFNRLGAYTSRVTIGTLSIDLKSNVVATATGIAVRNSLGQAALATTSSTTTALSQTWSATAFDQFGNAMAQQPTFTWTNPVSPIGSLPRIQTTGNAATVTFNRVGTYSVRAQSHSASFTFQVNVTSVLTRIALTTPDNVAVSPTVAIRTAATGQRLNVRGFDQFGRAMATMPSLTWTATTAPTQGTATATVTSDVATLLFNRSGSYSLRVAGGNATELFQVNVVQTFTSLSALGATNTPISSTAVIAVPTASTTVRAVANDQFGQPMATQPTLTWTSLIVPTGGTTTYTTANAGTTIRFNQVGSFSARVSSGAITQTIAFNVVATLTTINVTGASTVALGGSQQYTAQGVDQFDRPMATQPTVTWAATGGTINTTGLYRAGSTVGTYAITARSGTVTANLNVAVATPGAASSVTDMALRNLLTGLYADSSITRAEMIQILRSVGTDGSVSQTELTDLRAIIGAGSQFSMPNYVRELARDVVNANPANLRFKGQVAGNLAAGSSSTLLNNLVDKWFLGADEPVISGSGRTYQISTGNLFNGDPSRADAKQGYLGDCYLIAAVTAIADRNADAIRNVFIDNGDGTFTVRFFAGSADYVTVNRRLPAYSNGTLAYSGVGQAIANTSTTLWVALLEKAYAQWNETGNSGRNGTNTYSAIEGGWMSNVNAQVLGYRSSNYSFANTPKQTLISALQSGRAVTLGTTANPSNGFVGGHAYIITGYDASTDKFTTFNPWGNTHPAAATWDQLRANCTMFVVTDSAGTSPISNLSVRSSTSEVLIGNWTTAITGPSSFESTKLGSDVASHDDSEYDVRSENDILENVDRVSTEVAALSGEWVNLDEAHVRLSDLALAELADATLDEIYAINAIAVDLAMSLEDIDSLLV
ncbi:MAG: C2 family cysteine protease [Planctomycetota bacterium]|nr:C2 family cysteine protease [Planctomycetota bacterium]